MVKNERNDTSNIYKKKFTKLFFFCQTKYKNCKKGRKNPGIKLSTPLETFQKSFKMLKISRTLLRDLGRQKQSIKKNKKISKTYIRVFISFITLKKMQTNWQNLLEQIVVYFAQNQNTVQLFSIEVKCNYKGMHLPSFIRIMRPNNLPQITSESINPPLTRVKRTQYIAS